MRDRRTRSRRSASLRDTWPGARTTTITPSRIRTATRAPRIGRVVSRISALWSPGRARRGTADDTVSVPFARGRRESRRGRSASHEAAAARRRGTTLGRPRRSRENPALLTSSSTGLLPEFVTRTFVLPYPTSVTRAGDAPSETGGRAVLAPAEADASPSRAAATAPATEAVIGRLPSA